MASNDISSRISELYNRIEYLQRPSANCPVKIAETLSYALEELRMIRQEICTFEEELRSQNKKLTEVAELFRTALEFTYDWETWIDPDGFYIYVSPSCERITGYSAEEFLTDPSLVGRIVHPLDRELFPRHFKCREDDANPIEFRIVARNGEERWISHFCQPVFDSAGRYLGRRASNRDITKRRQAEDAALQAKEDWEQTFAAVPDLIFIIDNDFRIVRANKAMATRLGTTTEALAGLKCYHAVHGTEEPPSFCPHKLMMEDGLEHILEVHEDRLGGDYVVSVSPLVDAKGRIIGSAHVAHDVTERKQALVALQQSNERRDLALKAADAGTWDMNTSTGVIDWSSKVFDIFGLDQRETVPSIERWNALLHPEDRKRASFQIGQALKTHTGLDIEYRIVRPDGKTRWINVLGESVYDDHGAPGRMIGICLDITERKRAEVALLEAKLEAEADRTHYEQVVSMISDMVWRYDANSKGEHVSTYISPVADRMLGLPDGTIGNSVEKYLSHIHPEDFPAMQNVVSEAIRTHANDSITEYRMRKADGSIIWVRSRGSVYSRPDGGITAFGTTSDITEHKQDEEQLKRYSEHLVELVEERTKQLKDAERMATIGETALMVGHDLRNPLQAIVNTTYLAESKIESLSLEECNDSMNQSLLEYLRTIDRQSEYMNKIVSDLQDYARPLRPETMVIGISSFVADVLAGMKIPEDVDVQIEIEDRLSWKVDPTMMARVLVNLVTNALQAMPSSGTLIITAFDSEKGMVLNVEDDGVGIPPDLIPKIFDPLFTTKSRGMGLGLVVARRMVEAQGGSLDLNSNSGKGTIAVIKMPRLPDAVSITGNGIHSP